MDIFHTIKNPTNITTPGQYTVSVTNFYGCTVVLQSSVPACAPMELQGDIQPSCPGQAVGALSVSVSSGGLAPYSYAWSHDAALSGPAAAHLAAGAYQVTVTDARGCQAIGQYDIPDAAPLSLSAAIAHDCGMQHQGSINLSGSGGIGALSYQWHNGWPQPNLQGLGMGLYKVTATDSRGCRATGNYEVHNHALPQLSAQVEPARCLDAQDGAITLSVSTDGNAPYTTLWNTGATGNTLSGLAAGNYSVVVSDQNGCATSATYSTTPAGPQDAMPYIRRVRIYAPQPHPPDIDLYAAEWVSTSAGCIFFTGGSLPISQAMFDALAAGQQSLTIEVEASEVMAQVFSGFNSQTFPNNDVQTFTLFIPSTSVPQLISNNSIYQPLMFTGQDLDGNQLLDLRELSDNLSACVEVPLYQPDCQWQPPLAGGNTDDVHILTRLCMDLSIAVLADQQGGFNLKAIVPGDVQQYTFVWSDVSGNIVGNQFTLNGVGPGRYCVKVSGPGGCVAELCENVCESLEDVLDRQLQTTAPCPGQSDGVICITDSYVPLLVQWFPAGPAGLCLEGVAPGIAYCAQVTELACAQQLTYCPDPLSAVGPPVLNLADAGASCPGGAQGFLLVSASGGKPPYVYQWSNGAAGPLAQGLAGATSYTVTVSDACGQQLSQSFSVPAYNPPVFTGATDNAACGESHNGALRVFHQGGQAPFAYQWSGPAGYSASGAEPFINDLAPGNYYVTVTDACGQSTAGGPFEVGWINSANYFQIGAAVIEHICGPDPLGAIDLTVTAADPGSLTYAWSNGATVEDINGLAAGIYSVTVSYENGCSSVKHYNVFQSQIFDLQESLLNPYCKLDDGTISLTPIGQNTGQINFTWSNGAQTEDIAGLPPGTYGVTLTYGLYDICTYSESFTLQQEFTDLSAAVIDITPETQILEDGFLQGEQNGAVTVSLSGGYPPYSFQWSNGATTQNLSDAASGTYWLTVTDNRGCEALVSAFVWLCDFQWPSLQLAFGQITPISSSGGAIMPTLSGGTPPFEFSWSGPGGFSANTLTISDLAQNGNYTLTVVDRCGRSDVLSVHLDGCEHAQELNVNTMDQCLGNLLEDSRMVLINVKAGTPFDLNGLPVWIGWTKNGGIVDSGMTTLAGSSPYYDVVGPLRDYDIPSSTELSDFCVKVTDFWGCHYEECRRFGPKYWVGPFFEVNDLNLSPNLIINQYLSAPYDAITYSWACQTCDEPFEGVGQCTSDFETAFHYDPIQDANPCQGGGTIYLTNNSQLSIPPNYLATLLEGDDNMCACLFPVGTVRGLPEGLQEFPVYVEFECHPTLDPPPPPQGFCDNCEQCIVDDTGEPCSYVLICLGNEEIPPLPIPGNDHVCYMIDWDGTCYEVTFCSDIPCIPLTQIPVDEEICYQDDVFICPSCLTDGIVEDVVMGMPAHRPSDRTPDLRPIVDKENTPFATKVFPNPFSSSIFIAIARGEAQTLRVALEDMTGREVYARTEEIGVSVDSFRRKIEISPPRLPNGMYVLVLENENGQRDRHLVLRASQ